MTGGAQIATLPDGRLHLHHGPIDLLLTAEGPEREVAFEDVTRRFENVLGELSAELDRLTEPFDGRVFRSPIARRMSEAVAPFAKDRFITPMAAVAGAVADEMLARLAAHDLTKATVNNGGDIAFLLTKGEVFRALTPSGTVDLCADQAARGMATSGWRGRSQSFGIADAVTVLARTAARADAAATLIANAVDLPGHPAITRRPAREVEAIPQLEDRLVTVAVGALIPDEVGAALSRGAAYAETLRQRRLIEGAALLLNGDSRITGSSGIATALPVDPS